MKVLEGNYDRDFGPPVEGEEKPGLELIKNRIQRILESLPLSHEPSKPTQAEGVSPEASAPGEGNLPGAPGSTVV